MLSHWNEKTSGSFQDAIDHQLEHGQMVSFKEFEYDCIIYVFIDSLNLCASPTDKNFYEVVKLLCKDIVASSDRR